MLCSFFYKKIYGCKKLIKYIYKKYFYFFLRVINACLWWL